MSGPGPRRTISRSTASADRLLKMHYYGDAHIPWCLIVEPTTGNLRLYRAEGRHYREHAAAKPGGTLRPTEPVAAEIDPAALLPPSQGCA